MHEGGDPRLLTNVWVPLTLVILHLLQTWFTTNILLQYLNMSMTSILNLLIIPEQVSHP